MDNLMLRRRLMMAAQGVWTTVTATTPFSVQNALKSKMQSLIQYGKMVQNGTPTPDAPVWPSINNGVVRMVWQGDGVAEGDGLWRRAYINTTSSTWNYYEDASSSIRIPIQSGQYRLHWDKTDTSDVGTIFRVGFAKTDTMPSTGTPVQLYKADGTKGLEVASSPQNAQTVELEVSGTGINYMVIQVSGSNSAWSSGDFGELWARISHLHLQTRQLSVDGTPETLTVGGRNLFDSATMQTTNAMATVSGKCYWGYQASNLATAIKVPVKPNTTYTLSYVGGNRCMIGGFTNDVPLDATDRRVCDFTIFAGASAAVSPKTFTTPDNCNFICCGLGNSNGGTVANIQLELGDTATAYEPYRAPQTATVPDLFAVGGYKDDVDIISGTVTRRVGKVALTSDLPWFTVTGQTGLFGVPVADGKWAANQLAVSSHYAGTVATNANMPDNTIKATHASTLAPNKISIYVKDTTHGTSLDTFKAWLDEAGVIAIFPLVTPVTESITPQELSTVKGANVIDATSDIAPFDVSVTYRARK